MLWVMHDPEGPENSVGKTCGVSEGNVIATSLVILAEVKLPAVKLCGPWIPIVSGA